MSWIFLLAALAGAGLTINLYFPTARTPLGAMASFVGGFVVGELALHVIALQLACTIAFGMAGALDGTPGQIGLAISMGSWSALLLFYLLGDRAQDELARALRFTLGPRALVRDADAPAPELDVASMLKGLVFGDTGVKIERNVVYATVDERRLRLDVYTSRATPPTQAPVLVHIHGGAWAYGSKRGQGQPLMHHLAQRGWVCVSVEYRLGPKATFPAPLIDVKRALVFVKRNIQKYGGDPSFVAVTGGSAGGHLAALLALTAGDAEYQPGFESADTGVQACVPMYGVMDLTNRFGLDHNDGLRELVEKNLIGRAYAADPEAFEKASPIARVHPGAPPFFIVHGANDTLVAPAAAHAFASELVEKSRAPVVYAELWGAQHGFDIFPSIRTQHTAHAIELFLDHCRRARVRVPSAGALRGASA